MPIESKADSSGGGEGAEGSSRKGKTTHGPGQQCGH